MHCAIGAYHPIGWDRNDHEFRFHDICISISTRSSIATDPCPSIDRNNNDSVAQLEESNTPKSVGQIAPLDWAQKKLNIFVVAQVVDNITERVDLKKFLPILEQINGGNSKSLLMKFNIILPVWIECPYRAISVR